MDRVNMVPLAFDTFGRWGEEAVRALRAAVRRRLVRPDAQRGVTLKGAHSQLLRRWRAAGACAVQRRNWDVWRDCLGEVAQARGGVEEGAGIPGRTGAGSLLDCLLSAGTLAS